MSSKETIWWVRLQVSCLILMFFAFIQAWWMNHPPSAPKNQYTEIYWFAAVPALIFVAFGYYLRISRPESTWPTWIWSIKPSDAGVEPLREVRNGILIAVGGIILMEAILWLMGFRP